MPVKVEDLISTCFDELQLSQRFVPYIQQAEDAGYPLLARFFRALVASETAREALMRKGLVNHADQQDEIFICPHCGLIFLSGCPDQCPVDETLSETFILIQ